MEKHTCLEKWFVFGLFLLTLCMSPATPLWAEEEKPTGDFTTAFLNQYIWRGYESSRESMVIQPSLTIGYKGFSVNLWGNLDTKPYSGTDTSYSGAWNETDLTLSYSTSLGPVTLGGGYIYYGLAPLNKDSADRNDAQELFASVSLNTLLTPTLTIYKEIDRYRDWYFLLGISHAFELSKAVSLKLAASAGYVLSTEASTYPKFDDSALATTEKFQNFHEGTLSASLPIKLTDRITVTPTLSYIFPLTDDAKNEMKGYGLEGNVPPSQRDSSFIVGGIMASFSF